MKIEAELNRLEQNIELLKQRTLALEKHIAATLEIQLTIVKEINYIHARIHNICNYVQTHQS